MRRTLLSWIAKRSRPVSTEPNSSAPGFSTPTGSASPLLIIKGLLLMPVALAISLGVKWSVSSTIFLYGFCRRNVRQPAFVNKAFNRFLLVKIQTEQAVTNIAQYYWVIALQKIAPELLQHEEASCGKRHDGGVAAESAMQEEVDSFATLSYYTVSETPGTLAIVRYHAKDDHDRSTVVGEDRFDDTPEDFCRLQDDVEEALLSGVDVCVMSCHEPDTFEGIAKFLIDLDDTEEPV